MSRSSSLAPCSLPQQAEQDGPDPRRDLRNLAGCAINRQRRGGSGAPPAAAPACGNSARGMRDAPAQRGGWGCALGAAPVQPRCCGESMPTGAGVCAAGVCRGSPRPTAQGAQPCAAAQGSRSSHASMARDPPSSAPVLHSEEDVGSGHQHPDGSRPARKPHCPAGTSPLPARSLPDTCREHTGAAFYTNLFETTINEKEKKMNQKKTPLTQTLPNPPTPRPIKKH